MAIRFTSPLDLSNQRITNVTSPSVGTDVANKDYVDSVAQGLDWKSSVRAASTGNVDLAAPGATLDGVNLASGDRVLLKDQTAGAENGIYVWTGAAAALTRATDANSSTKVSSGLTLSVEEGAVNADKTFVLVTNGPITLDTTALAFTVMSGGTGTTYTGTAPINVSGSVISLAPDAGTSDVTVSGNNLVLKPQYKALRAVFQVGDGSTLAFTLNHALGTRDCIVQVYDKATGETVFCDVVRTDNANVTLTFGAAPGVNAYGAVVLA